jgi:hypothetical protein
VCDQETSKNEEAKARYRAVENTTTMGCNARKTNKQQYYTQQLISAVLKDRDYTRLSTGTTQKYNRTNSCIGVAFL